MTEHLAALRFGPRLQTPRVRTEGDVALLWVRGEGSQDRATADDDHRRVTPTTAA